MQSRKGTRTIRLVTQILKANDRVAEENRRRFSEAGVFVIDLMGSPGAGKTALLEATLPRLVPEVRVAVIVGDIATARDAERIAPLGVPVVQIVTEAFGGSCHLEASTIRQALDQVDLENLDLLFIENVGNLVCPAEFDLGQNARIIVLSLTEGEDKPVKYPLAFRTADLVIVSKIDLKPHLRVRMDTLRENLRQVNARVDCLELSAQTSECIDGWLAWIRNAMKPASSLPGGHRMRPGGLKPAHPEKQEVAAMSRVRP